MALRAVWRLVACVPAIAAPLLIASAAVAQMPPSLQIFSMGMDRQRHESDLKRCTDAHFKLDKRVEYCSRLADSGYDDAQQAQLELAILYGALGDYPDALKSVNEVLAKTGDDAALEQRAILYAQMGRYEMAVADSNEAISDSQSPKAYANRCRVRAIVNRDVQEGLADCNHALSLKPEDTNALEARALLNFKQAKFEQARADAEAALKRDEHLATARYILGASELRSNDSADGQVEVERAVSEDPDIAREMSAIGIASFG